MVRTKSDDADEQRVIDDIQEFGWHVVGVEADEDGPAFAYSIGLQQTLNHPEIVVLGLNDAETMMYIINTVGEEVRKGSVFENWHESDEILNGYSCMFRKVSAEAYPDYFGYAQWYYRPESFPVLQCVWPDREHRYPWHTGCQPSIRQRQPILADDDGWPFHEGKNRAVFTTTGILDGSQPVLLVKHSTDGDWQFLTGATIQTSDGKLVGLEHIHDRDKSVGELADLLEGWQAVRPAPGSPWQRCEA